MYVFSQPLNCALMVCPHPDIPSTPHDYSLDLSGFLLKDGWPIALKTTWCHAMPRGALHPLQKPEVYKCAIGESQILMGSVSPVCFQPSLLVFIYFVFRSHNLFQVLQVFILLMFFRHNFPRSEFVISSCAHLLTSKSYGFCMIG